VKLAEMCLQVHGAKKGWVVLDPFMGLGTTAVAAARAGVPSIGFDLDEAYLAFAKTRLEEELGRLL
jgi:site-specific DNA-methyltransferase (adenine-specific)